MKEYTQYEHIENVEKFVHDYGMILNGNPRVEMQEKYMARGSYEAFYFRILSEKSKPYRRGIFLKWQDTKTGFILFIFHLIGSFQRGGFRP